MHAYRTKLWLALHYLHCLPPCALASSHYVLWWHLCSWRWEDSAAEQLQRGVVAVFQSLAWPAKVSPLQTTTPRSALLAVYSVLVALQLSDSMRVMWEIEVCHSSTIEVAIPEFRLSRD